MGAVSFDALLRSLKQGSQGGPREAGRGAVYYLHGDEEVLKDEAIRALVDRALEPGTHDFNFDQRSAADLEPQIFHTLVNTPPMLAARRAVVIRGLEDLKKASKMRQELVRYLGAPNPSTLLILVQGAGDPPDPELARGATTVAAERLAPARVHQWVADRAARLPLALAPDALEVPVEDFIARIPWRDIEAVGLAHVSGQKMPSIRLARYNNYMASLLPEAAHAFERRWGAMKWMARATMLLANEQSLGEHANSSTLADVMRANRALTGGYDMSFAWSQIDRPAAKFAAFLEAEWRERQG